MCESKTVLHFVHWHPIFPSFFVEGLLMFFATMTALRSQSIVRELPYKFRHEIVYFEGKPVLINL